MLAELTKTDGCSVWVNPKDVGSIDDVTACKGAWGAPERSKTCVFMRGVMLSYHVQESAPTVARLLDEARDDLVASLSVFGPGDVVVLRTVAPLPKEQRDQVADDIRDKIGNKVVILPHGVEVAAVVATERVCDTCHRPIPADETREIRGSSHAERHRCQRCAREVEGGIHADAH